MMHPIPKEYSNDAKLMTLYNNGFKEGFYGIPIVERCVMTDHERLAYSNGRKAGEIRKKEVMLND